MGLHNNFPDGANGAQGRFLRFNETNEIKGIQIEYTGYLDDKQDPATALSVGRQLVQQDQVFAVIPNLSQYTPGDYFTQQKVPWFGWGFDATYCSPTPSDDAVRLRLQRLPHPAGSEADARLRLARLYKYVSEKTGEEKPTLAMFSNETDSGKQRGRHAGVELRRCGLRRRLREGPAPAAAAARRHAVRAGPAHLGRRRTARRDRVPAVGRLPRRSTSSCRRTTTTGTFQTPLYSDLLARPLEGSVASVQYVPFDDEHAAAAADDRGHPRLQGGRRDQLGCGGVVLRGRHVHRHAEAAEEAEAWTSRRRTCRRLAAKSTFEVKGLFGPTKFPDVDRDARHRHARRSCSPTARRGRPSSPTSAPRKTFKVQQKYIDAA